MLAAASPAEAMAKVRQKARLFQKPARSRGGASERRRAILDAGPDLAGGATAGNAIGQSAKPRLPERDLAPRMLGSRAMPELGGAPIRRRSSTPSTYSAAVEVVRVVTVYGVFVAHRSRHALSFTSPRLIQLFMVPSGTPCTRRKLLIGEARRGTRREWPSDWRCSSSSRQPAEPRLILADLKPLNARWRRIGDLRRRPRSAGCAREDPPPASGRWSGSARWPRAR